MVAPSQNTRWWPITGPVATTDSPWEDHTRNSTKKNKKFLLTVIPFCKVVRTGSFCATKNVNFKGAIINHIQNKGYSEVFWHLTKFWFLNWKITSFTLQSFLLVDVFAKQNSSWQSKNRALSYPIQMECLQYVPVNSKTAHSPGQTKAQRFIERWSYWTYKSSTRKERWDPQEPMTTEEASFCPFNRMEFLYVFLERASKAQRF